MSKTLHSPDQAFVHRASQAPEPLDVEIKRLRKEHTKLSKEVDANIRKMRGDHVKGYRKPFLKTLIERFRHGAAPRLHKPA